MAKVHPTSSAESTLNQDLVSDRESFTIWMKSLVFNGSGCTVYDSKGKIVYRVDNYSSKRCKTVYLMDLSGAVLLKIVKKKLGVFESWEGYKCNNSELYEIKPWFRVKKISFQILRTRHPLCQVCSRNGDNSSRSCYHIDAIAGNSSSCKIVDTSQGTILAEVKRKSTRTGIALGDDVLVLEVEPRVDHSLIMGLVIAHSLMNHTM